MFIFTFTLSTIDAQSIKIRACARTTDVDPVKDNQGNDRRHLSAFKLDYIHIEEFSPAKTVYAQIGVDGQTEWEDDVWVDGCQNNQAFDSCDGCNTCKSPRFKNGDLAGSISGDIENNVRVRTEDNDLFIEATNVKDVCYETEWIDVWQAGRKALLLRIGYQGTTTNDDTRTQNIKLDYVISTDGQYRNFINDWSNFEQGKEAEIVTIFLSAIDDLAQEVNMNISPNPVEDRLIMSLHTSYSRKVKMTISDLIGKPVITKDVSIESGESTRTIDVSQLPAGTYFLSLSDKNMKVVKRFLKQ